MSVSSTFTTTQEKGHTVKTNNYYQHITRSSNFRGEVDKLLYVELYDLLTDVVVSGNLDNIKYLIENKGMSFSTYHVKSAFHSSVSVEIKKDIIAYILKEVKNSYQYFKLLSEEEMSLLIQWNLFKDETGSYCMHCLNPQNRQILPFVKLVWTTINVDYRCTLREISQRMLRHDVTTAARINDLLVSTDVPIETCPNTKDMLTFLHDNDMTDEANQLKDWIYMYAQKK
jgi:hypothetical protein